MFFISEFPKDDQEYILKAYPLALQEAAKKGHTDFIKELIVINKIDKIDDTKIMELKRIFPEAIFISANQNIGIEELLVTLDNELPDPSQEIQLTIPYSRGDLLARIHDEGKIIELNHLENGTYIHAFVPSNLGYLLTSSKFDE